MEQEEEEALPMQPFWLPNSDHRHRRRLRRSYSLLVTSTSLLVLFLVTALTLVFIVLPTLHSFAAHVFKPHTVKNSWESLNLLLVLFAIACAFLTKTTTTTTTTTTEPEPETRHRRSFSNLPPQDHYAKPNSIESRTWYEYEYEYEYPGRTLSRLRSFNSYPDLRQDSPWVAADERRRFYDDSDTYLLRHRQPRPEEEEAKEEKIIENVPTVTSGEVASAPPQPPPSPLPSPSPLPPRTKAVRRNPKRTYQAEIEKPSTPPPPPPPPSPPPPATVERKTVQGKKRRGSATKEFLTSLRGKKKKKQRHTSVENFETILSSEPFSIPSQSPPSPPSVFQNLFSSKKSKHKKRHTDPVAIHNRPGSSNKRERFYSSQEKNDVVITGNESPSIPIPPPPPPFKLPAWKFRVQGDFVRVDSIGSSGSSVVEEVGDSPVGQEASQCNSPLAGSLFYPSPDVDTKAHSFIERFRAGLRMEKMNSMKKKQGIGRSSLDSSTSPQTEQETTPG